MLPLISVKLCYINKFYVIFSIIQPHITYNNNNNLDEDDNNPILTEDDLDLGWRLEKSLASSYCNGILLIGNQEHLIKKWTKEEVADTNTVTSKIGTKKRTWEVASENSIHTYCVDDNPRYSDIVAEMRANMRRKDRETTFEKSNQTLKMKEDNVDKASGKITDKQ
jgi:hypothetical protein